MQMLLPKHFETYKTLADKWLKYWGISEYAVHYKFEPVEGGYGACGSDAEGGSAIIWLASEWDDHIKPTKESLNKIAFHEVSELLLARLSNIASDRFTTEDEIERERHRIIRRMENAML